MRPVTVVVVHRDRPEPCARTVAAIRSRTARPVRVVVVDNGSTPAALAAVRDLDDVEVLALGANTGFGPGANAGLRHALARPADDSGDWFGVCPHDAEVHEGCIDRLVEACEARPRAGLACAELGLDEVPVLDPYFGGLSVPAIRSTGWTPVGYPHGTFLLAGRACLEDIGLFDERYFAYCEEADLAIRAHRARWEVGMVWDARVTNTGLGSEAVPAFLMLRNTLAMVLRWSGPYHATIRSLIAVGQIAQARRTGDPLWRPQARGLADALRGRLGPPPTDLV